MTDNTSILSNPVGSVDCYSSLHSGHGLWSAGKPNTMSVTVQRIGYLTIKNGSVSLYKDTLETTTTAIEQIGNYQNGFLHNDLVPAAKLPQTNLFHPSP